MEAAKEAGRDELAELKLSIVQVQERLAELGRCRRRVHARGARDRLFRLLHRKDLLEQGH
jgi:hypothetical protein